ncbi:MAG: hypothetical protein R2733_17420 [Acidimicrobiales bacterium]
MSESDSNEVLKNSTVVALFAHGLSSVLAIFSVLGTSIEASAKAGLSAFILVPTLLVVLMIVQRRMMPHDEGSEVPIVGACGFGTLWAFTILSFLSVL